MVDFQSILLTHTYRLRIIILQQALLVFQRIYRLTLRVMNITYDTCTILCSINYQIAIHRCIKQSVPFIHSYVCLVLSRFICEFLTTQELCCALLNILIEDHDYKRNKPTTKCSHPNGLRGVQYWKVKHDHWSHSCTHATQIY